MSRTLNLFGAIKAIAVSILAGTMTSIVIAITISLGGSVLSLVSAEPRIGEVPFARPVSGWPKATARTIYKSAVATLIVNQALVYSDDAPQRPPGCSHYQSLYQFGWPRRSLEYQILASSGQRPHIVGGIRAPSWMLLGRRSDGIVPYRWLPSGTIVNAAYFGVLIWSLWCGWWAARRQVRAIRGKCCVCGYPVGESARCSECGERVWRGKN